MASCSGGAEIGGGTREELKSQFSTREGTYKLISAVEFSRATRPLTYVTNNNTSPGTTGLNPHVRLSFVTIKTPNHNNDGSNHSHSSTPSPTSSNRPINDLPHNNDTDGNPDVYTTNHRICFNLGKEIFIYPFFGEKPHIDMSKAIDKRVYKGTYPTCHDFNSLNATQDNLSLLIGFSGGQIQLVDPISKEVNKLFNEERIIEKTKVTCIKWVPKSLNMFVVSHSSGHMYLYDSEVTCGNITPPNYVVAKQGPGYSIWNCKSKVPRNPLVRWSIGEGAINEFNFSSCGQYIAFASQDGFLRIFKYDTYELAGLTRSYFGGLLCCCWSPDGKYICVGGEDDLVTIWSFGERRVVARGQGHKSWVTVVSFDPYASTYGDIDSNEDCGITDSGESCHRNNDQSSVFSCDAGAGPTTNSAQTSNSVVNKNNLINNSSNLVISPNNNTSISRPTRFSRTSENMRLSVSESSKNRIPICYRVASIGQDTQLCLWDLTEDVLQTPFGKTRPSQKINSSDLSPNSYNFINSSVKSQLSNSHYTTNTVQTSPNCTSSTNTTPVNCNSNLDKEENNSEAGASTNGSLGQSSSHGSGGGGSGGHGILSLRFGGLSFGGDKDKDKEKKENNTKEHKRNFSLGSSSKDNKKDSSGSSWKPNFSLSGTGINVNQDLEDPLKLIGTQACPRLDECPLLEPLVCKKISHERLTSLVFREDNIVTVCQDGIICCWSRPDCSQL